MQIYLHYYIIPTLFLHTFWHAIPTSFYIFNEVTVDVSSFPDSCEPGNETSSLLAGVAQVMLIPSSHTLRNVCEKEYNASNLLATPIIYHVNILENMHIYTQCTIVCI